MSVRQGGGGVAIAQVVFAGGAAALRCIRPLHGCRQGRVQIVEKTYRGSRPPFPPPSLRVRTTSLATKAYQYYTCAGTKSCEQLLNDCMLGSEDKRALPGALYIVLLRKNGKAVASWPGYMDLGILFPGPWYQLGI